MKAMVIAFCAINLVFAKSSHGAGHGEMQRRNISDIQSSVNFILKNHSRTEARLIRHGESTHNTNFARGIALEVQRDMQHMRARNSGIYTRDTNKMREASGILKNRIGNAKSLIESDMRLVKAYDEAIDQYLVQRSPISVQQQLKKARDDADEASGEATRFMYHYHDARKQSQSALQEASRARREAEDQRREAERLRAENDRLRHEAAMRGGR